MFFKIFVSTRGPLQGLLPTRNCGRVLWGLKHGTDNRCLQLASAVFLFETLLLFECTAQLLLLLLLLTLMVQVHASRKRIQVRMYVKKYSCIPVQISPKVKHIVCCSNVIQQKLSRKIIHNFF